MSTIRFFNGAGTTRKGMSRDDIKFHLESKNKMSTPERWKRMRDRKLAENRKNAAGGAKPFALPGAIPKEYKMSKSADQALQTIAKKKADKESKALRQMVVIQPRNFHNGRIAKDGKIFDIQGNIVAKVNKKDGSMTTMMGGSLGKYNPKSFATNSFIQGTIDRFSPYYINLRKMQAMQGEVVNVWGNTQSTGHAYDDNAAQGTRTNISATAWGAMSNNTWGTTSNNVWGTTGDNVWGTSSTDVWGGISGSSWGGVAKTVQNSGAQYIGGLFSRLVAFLRF